MNRKNTAATDRLIAVFDLFNDAAFNCTQTGDKRAY